MEYMSSDLITITKEQIKQITFGISSLDQHQREKVREHLFRLHDQEGGRIGRHALHLELLKMRGAYEISELDRQNIENAFFG